MQSGSNLYPQIWFPKICFRGDKQPKIGKWNEEQKKIFNIYSKLYEGIPKKYEYMAQHIPTRTPCQIRSHWQKFNEKKDRQKEKVGKNTSKEDKSFGKTEFAPGFDILATIPSDILPKPEKQLLNMKSIPLNLITITSGKPKGLSVQPIVTRRSQMDIQIEQEVFWGSKIVRNFIIVEAVSVRSLQKGEQLQKVPKGGEESNTLSNMESVEAQDVGPERKDQVRCLKHKVINKKEKKVKRGV